MMIASRLKSRAVASPAPAGVGSVTRACEKMKRPAEAVPGGRGGMVNLRLVPEGTAFSEEAF